MLLLEDTDALRLVTSAAVTVDVHASYVDYDGASPTTVPGRKNTAIATATTTDIVLAPASGFTRNVKMFSVRNKDVTPVAVTVVHFDGSVSVQLKKVTLEPEDELTWIEGVGFLML